MYPEFVASLILGTAGHIDHGKTALIKAITGIDADRLKAEKERGISIELGFANLKLPNGKVLGVVDVPGHEKLVRTMVAGATGMDIVLLVIAADDGIMPQTLEHLSIIDLLGIEKGVVAVTKTDLVEHDWVDMVIEDVNEMLVGTSIEGSPIVPVSSKTGEGLPVLIEKIETSVRGIERRKPNLPFRMPVDRVFTISGAGTVVTGTSWSGQLHLEDKVDILPRKIGSRVRSLQVHDKKVTEVGPGTRVAINLAGVSLEDVSRGDVVVSQDFEVKGSQKVMLELKLLNSAKPLKNRSLIRFHHGTKELIGRVILPQSDEIKPGQKCLAILRLPSPVVTVYDDPYIVRSYSPVNTIGGGRVLIPGLINTKRRNATVLMIADRLVNNDREGAVRVAVERLHHPLSRSDLTLVTGLWGQDLASVLENAGYWSSSILAEGQFYYSPKEWPEKAMKEISNAVANFHRLNPSSTGIEKENLRAMIFPKVESGVFTVLLKAALEKGLVKKVGNFISHPDAGKDAVDAEKQLMDEIYEILSVAAFSSTSESDLIKQLSLPAQVVRRALANLVSSGTVIRVKPDLIFTSESIDKAKGLLREEIIRTGGITPSEFKNLLSTSRKYAVPLLEFFDTTRVTRREGDKRVLEK